MRRHRRRFVGSRRRLPRSKRASPVGRSRASDWCRATSTASRRTTAKGRRCAASSRSTPRRSPKLGRRSGLRGPRAQRSVALRAAGREGQLRHVRTCRPPQARRCEGQPPQRRVRRHTPACAGASSSARPTLTSSRSVSRGRARWAARYRTPKTQNAAPAARAAGRASGRRQPRARGARDRHGWIDPGALERAGPRRRPSSLRLLSLDGIVPWRIFRTRRGRCAARSVTAHVAPRHGRL